MGQHLTWASAGLTGDAAAAASAPLLARRVPVSPVVIEVDQLTKCFGPVTAVDSLRSRSRPALRRRRDRLVEPQDAIFEPVVIHVAALITDDQAQMEVLRAGVLALGSALGAEKCERQRNHGWRSLRRSRWCTAGRP
jgi:hypothetical protein